MNARIQEAGEAFKERAQPERGWQVRLAEECGVERNAVSMWLAGRATPDKRSWPMIERALGMEHNELAKLAANYFLPGITDSMEQLGDELRRTHARLATVEDELAKALGRPRKGQRSGAGR